MIRVFLLFFLLVFTVVPHAWSQEENSEPAFDEAKEAEIAMKAKKRLYPGGRDEEELKVQAQVSTPVRKVAPQAELKEDEPAEE
ncbi:hypothetical protein [Bdellovibrio reynosensis]|uniref:Secreted protein n=1 Tax=Bdellovibrio reynosensis TaxID=2835041 RepID=A0ABY4CDR9_9BACT|nr:hypothetical protein [Bdellovibrio reynosensis]UOF02874.1 hypothetical protein MNR06_07895 [Bdellovibrio reynosensis]